jgi:hypothetical protein
MIADLDETIRQLLIKDLPVKNGEIDIKFEQPKREWSARLSKPTVNLFLYDLRENNLLRQHQWDQIREEKGTVTRKRSSMQLDCFYMLTTWAADMEDEHHLLTRSLMALFRYPIIPEDRLVGSMQHPKFEIQTRLAAYDRLTNPAELWASLDNEMRPSISYIVSMALDPWQEITGPAVRSVTFRTGQANAPDNNKHLREDGAGVNVVYFGGTVLDKDIEFKPLVGVQVAIKGTGLFTTTDQRGHYLLGGLPPGEYTLVVWPSSGRPVEKKVKLPASDDEYDIRI